MNVPIGPEYVLSEHYRTFGKQFSAGIELESLVPYEQNVSQTAMLVQVIENEHFTVSGISIEFNSPKRVKKRKEQN